MLTTRMAFAKADLLIVGGDIFEAATLDEAKRSLSERLRNIAVMGKATNPDSVRLIDTSGREVWRTKL